MHLFLVGAGHIGLVTAVGFVRLGHRVTVSDIDADRVAMLSDGRPPIYEPGLEAGIRDGLAGGELRFTGDAAPPPDSRFSIVCVPTPSGADGVLSTEIVESVVRGLLRTVPADHAIVVRSTLPLHGPDRLLEIAGEGRRPPIVTNPEFLREGNAIADFERPNRVVTGWLVPSDRPAAEAFAALYAPFNAPTIVADARSVALIKLASNVFLGTKIAFANELARLSDAIGADVMTVVEGLGLDARIGPAFLQPGPGFGGSCLPEQAAAIAVETGRREVAAPLLNSVARSNSVHQSAIVRHLAALLSADGSLAGRRVAVLGLAFKADTDDVRHSPGLALAGELRSAGAEVVGFDPIAMPNARLADAALEVAPDATAAAAGADAVVVATEWPAFRTLDWAGAAKAMRGDLVYDTRRVVDGDAARRAGLRYVALGRAATAPGDTAAGARTKARVDSIRR